VRLVFPPCTWPQLAGPFVFEAARIRCCATARALKNEMTDMDALTVSFIVALVGAIAFVAVAVITAHARIGLLPAIAIQDSSKPSHVPIGLTESAKKFRVLGWMLVLFLYLTAIFCLLQGLNDLRIFFHWEQWEAYFGGRLSDRAEIALYSKFWIVISVMLIIIGFWAQSRLRRRST
jgi:hypothetical protein